MEYFLFLCFVHLVKVSRACQIEAAKGIPWFALDLRGRPFPSSILCSMNLCHLEPSFPSAVLLRFLLCYFKCFVSKSKCFECGRHGQLSAWSPPSSLIPGHPTVWVLPSVSEVIAPGKGYNGCWLVLAEFLSCIDIKLIVLSVAFSILHPSLKLSAFFFGLKCSWAWG